MKNIKGFAFLAPLVWVVAVGVVALVANQVHPFIPHI